MLIGMTTGGPILDAVNTTETTSVERYPSSPSDSSPLGATLPISDQYEALATHCALVDRSERGKLALTGEDTMEFLNGQVTAELLDLLPGEGRYAAFLTHKGKMLGDLRILAPPGAQPAKSAGHAPPVRPTDTAEPGHTSVVPGELLLDTERVALQALFDLIRRFKVGYRVELHKRTLERALLSLIGPESDRVAAATLSSGEPPGEAEHAHTQVEIAGTPALLIRTDLGLDALFDAAAAESVRTAFERAGAASVSEGAAEIVRVESGRPRYGIDIDDTTIPQEAGLNERAVSFTKGCYVGQETVARLHYRGKPNRHLRGLRLSMPPSETSVLPAPGTQLLLGDRLVGSLGSTVLSPRLGPIALALVRHEAEPGAALALADSGVTATVVELPFG